MNARPRQLAILGAVAVAAVAVIFLLKDESPRRGSAGRLEAPAGEATRERAPLPRDGRGILPASLPDPDRGAASRAASRPTKAQLERILGAFDGLESEALGSLDLAGFALEGVLLSVWRSRVSASSLLAEIETLAPTDPKAWKLLIALSMTSGFTGENKKQVDRLLLDALRQSDTVKNLDAPALVAQRLAAAHCLRLQGRLAPDADIVAILKEHGPGPKGFWRHSSSSLVAAMILDGAGEQPSEEMRGLADWTSRSNSDATLLGAAWRVVTADTTNPAFEKSAGEWLRGNYGQTAALFSTSNPAHENTLTAFLQADLSKTLDRSLAAYSMAGLFRVNTLTARAAAEALVRKAASGDAHAALVLGHLDSHSADCLDPSALPGLFAVYGVLDGKGRDLVGPAMHRVTGSINGLGMTPVRRTRLRRALIGLLRSEDAGVMARLQAVVGLTLAGTIEDVPALEACRGVEGLGAADAAISAITTRTPEAMWPEAGPPKED